MLRRLSPEVSGLLDELLQYNQLVWKVATVCAPETFDHCRVGVEGIKTHMPDTLFSECCKEFQNRVLPVGKSWQKRGNEDSQVPELL